VRPRKASWKTLLSSGRSAWPSLSGVGAGLGVGGELVNQVAADVAGHQDQGVAEVDLDAGGVAEHAAIEDLIEDLHHVGVGLFDLVEEHDGVGLATDRLGENAALVRAYVAVRRAGQPRDAVLFLILRHVEGDHVALAAVERLGEGQRRLGLADAARAHEQEHPDGATTVLESGAAGADALTDGFQGVVLADDPLPQHLGQTQHRFDVVFDHPPQRNPGPARDHRGNGRRVDKGMHERFLALDRRQLGTTGLELLDEGCFLFLR
jgi:hypothetical protein